MVLHLSFVLDAHIASTWVINGIDLVIKAKVIIAEFKSYSNFCIASNLIERVPCWKFVRRNLTVMNFAVNRVALELISNISMFLIYWLLKSGTSLRFIKTISTIPAKKPPIWAHQAVFPPSR